MVNQFQSPSPERNFLGMDVSRVDYFSSLRMLLSINQGRELKAIEFSDANVEKYSGSPELNKYCAFDSEKIAAESAKHVTETLNLSLPNVSPGFIKGTGTKEIKVTNLEKSLYVPYIRIALSLNNTSFNYDTKDGLVDIDVKGEPTGITLKGPNILRNYVKPESVWILMKNGRIANTI